MPLILHPLGALPTLNMWPKFEVKRTYGSWVMATYFINDCSKCKLSKESAAKKLKTQVLIVSVIKCW